MFEAILSEFTTLVRNTVRAVGAATRRTPWLAPAVILAFFLML